MLRRNFTPALAADVEMEIPAEDAALEMLQAALSEAMGQGDTAAEQRERVLAALRRQVLARMATGEADMTAVGQVIRDLAPACLGTAEAAAKMTAQEFSIAVAERVYLLVCRSA